MRRIIITVFLASAFQAIASTFSRDTIDNWQVYNGVDLLFAGNALPKNQITQVTLKKSEMRDLIIQFNHCQAYSDMNVTIELIDEFNNKVMEKKYVTSSHIRPAIRKAELAKLGSKTFKIRYREDIANGWDIILGQIKLID